MDGRAVEDPELPDGYVPTVGLHQDGTHPELGPAHFQREFPGDTDAQRDGVDLVGNSPLAILDYFVDVVPGRVRRLRADVGRG